MSSGTTIERGTTIECGITLGDGTQLQMEAGYDADVSLWMWEQEAGTYSPGELLEMMLDEEKTREITWRNGTETETWTGFTEFASIQRDRAGVLRVRMRKPMTD